MSRIWTPDRQIVAPSRRVWTPPSRQRGFVCLPGGGLGAGRPGGDTDPYFANVSLLLHMDGSTGSTTFTDHSPSPKTVTANGNAKISTAQSKFGGASGIFDGTGDYLQIADNDAFQFGGVDFTIEAFVRLSGFAKSEGGTYASAIVSKDISTGRQWFLTIYGSASAWTEVHFFGFSSNSTYQSVSGSISISNNVWYHIAVCRSGSSARIFVDGTQAGINSSWSTSIQNTTTRLTVAGQFYDDTYRRELNGYIDDIRITKGVARYTANFTPPTAPFPNA